MLKRKTKKERIEKFKNLYSGKSDVNQFDNILSALDKSDNLYSTILNEDGSLNQEAVTTTQTDGTTKENSFANFGKEKTSVTIPELDEEALSTFSPKTDETTLSKIKKDTPTTDNTQAITGGKKSEAEEKIEFVKNKFKEQGIDNIDIPTLMGDVTIPEDITPDQFFNLVKEQYDKKQKTTAPEEAKPDDSATTSLTLGQNEREVTLHDKTSPIYKRLARRFPKGKNVRVIVTLDNEGNLDWNKGAKVLVDNKQVDFNKAFGVGVGEKNAGFLGIATGQRRINDELSSLINDWNNNRISGINQAKIQQAANDAEAKRKEAEAAQNGREAQLKREQEEAQRKAEEAAAKKAEKPKTGGAKQPNSQQKMVLDALNDPVFKEYLKFQHPTLKIDEALKKDLIDGVTGDITKKYISALNAYNTYKSEPMNENTLQQFYINLKRSPEYRQLLQQTNIPLFPSERTDTVWKEYIKNKRLKELAALGSTSLKKVGGIIVRQQGGKIDEYLKLAKDAAEQGNDLAYDRYMGEVKKLKGESVTTKKEDKKEDDYSDLLYDIGSIGLDLVVAFNPDPVSSFGMSAASEVLQEMKGGRTMTDRALGYGSTALSAVPLVGGLGKGVLAAKNLTKLASKLSSLPTSTVGKMIAPSLGVYGIAQGVENKEELEEVGSEFLQFLNNLDGDTLKEHGTDIALVLGDIGAGIAGLRKPSPKVYERMKNINKIRKSKLKTTQQPSSAKENVTPNSSGIPMSETQPRTMLQLPEASEKSLKVKQLTEQYIKEGFTPEQGFSPEDAFKRANWVTRKQQGGIVSRTIDKLKRGGIIKGQGGLTIRESFRRPNDPYEYKFSNGEFLTKDSRKKDADWKVLTEKTGRDVVEDYFNKNLSTENIKTIPFTSNPEAPKIPRPIQTSSKESLKTIPYGITGKANNLGLSEGTNVKIDPKSFDVSKFKQKGAFGKDLFSLASVLSEYMTSKPKKFTAPMKLDAVASTQAMFLPQDPLNLDQMRSEQERNIPIQRTSDPALNRILGQTRTSAINEAGTKARLTNFDTKKQQESQNIQIASANQAQQNQVEMRQRQMLNEAVKMDTAANKALYEAEQKRKSDLQQGLLRIGAGAYQRGIGEKAMDKNVDLMTQKAMLEKDLTAMKNTSDAGLQINPDDYEKKTKQLAEVQNAIALNNQRASMQQSSSSDNKEQLMQMIAQMASSKQKGGMINKKEEGGRINRNGTLSPEVKKLIDKKRLESMGSSIVFEKKKGGKLNDKDVYNGTEIVDSNDVDKVKKQSTLDSNKAIEADKDNVDNQIKNYDDKNIDRKYVDNKEPIKKEGDPLRDSYMSKIDKMRKQRKSVMSAPTMFFV